MYSPGACHKLQVVVVLFLKLDQKNPEECNNIFISCPLLTFFSASQKCVYLVCMWSSLEFCVALDSEKNGKIAQMIEVMGGHSVIERREFWDEIYFNI